MPHLTWLVLWVAILGTAILVRTPANAAPGVELGQLNCDVEGGTGFVFRSTRELVCQFKSIDSSIEPETYYGDITKYGLDLGVTGRTIILWTVVAAERELYAPGALIGTYAGPTASASFGAGLGANVLIGGSREGFALQPVSVSATTGVNVAIGFAQLELRQ